MKLSHTSWKNYVTHLECSRTGKHYPHSRPIGLSDDGAPIVVRYDLNKIAKELKKEDLKTEKIPSGNTKNCYHRIIQTALSPSRKFYSSYPHSKPGTR